MEDWIAEEELNEVERLRHYLTSKVPLQRLSHVRQLSTYVRQASYASCRNMLLSLLADLAADDVEIQAALATQIPLLSQICVESGYYDDVLEMLLPNLAALLTDDGPQGRECAGEAVVKVAVLLRPDDLVEHLLRSVIALAHHEHEEHRCSAPKILNDLGAVLGAELCRDMVLPQLQMLAEDAAFRVRKAVVLNVDHICKAIGADHTAQHILPMYLSLSRDEIWGVRKACAETIVSLAHALPMSVRTAHLVPLLHRFSNDVSRWVRTAALQQLGPFVATLDSPQVTAQMIDSFTAMANPANADTDLSRSCAYNLPAVLVTIGPERWRELRQTYDLLVRDVQWKVRRTLSHSLHEIARVLGPDLADVDLLPAFELFLKDLDEVKVGIVRHLASFLSALKPETRRRYVYVLDEIQKEKVDNWRFRKLLAKQLVLLSRLFERPLLTQVIVPLASRLCRDPVAAVRHVTNAQMGILYCELHAQNAAEAKAALLADIQALLAEKSYLHRQMYVRVCCAIVDRLDASSFVQIFLPGLSALASDLVPNVRLLVARFLSDLLHTSSSYASLAAVQPLVSALASDPDRDVRFFAARCLLSDSDLDPRPDAVPSAPPSSRSPLAPSFPDPDSDSDVDMPLRPSLAAARPRPDLDGDPSDSDPNPDLARRRGLPAPVNLATSFDAVTLRASPPPLHNPTPPATPPGHTPSPSLPPPRFPPPTIRHLLPSTLSPLSDQQSRVQPLGPTPPSPSSASSLRPAASRGPQDPPLPHHDPSDPLLPSPSLAPDVPDIPAVASVGASPAAAAPAVTSPGGGTGSHVLAHPDVCLFPDDPPRHISTVVV